MIGDREIMIKEKIVSPFVKTLVNSNALDKIEDNMMPLKRKQAEREVFKNEQLYRFFPSTYTSEQMRREILEILKSWRNSNWI